MSIRSLLIRRALATIAGVAALAAPSRTFAQASGSLGRAARPLGITEQAVRSDSNDVALATFLLNPFMTSSLRSSAFAAAVGAGTAGGEAKIQLNLCAWPVECGATHAWALTLAGPINKSDPPTELADLDGLVGKTRVELSGGLDVADASPGFRWTMLARVALPTLTYRPAVNQPTQTTQPAQYGAGASLGYKWMRTALLGGWRYDESRTEATPTAVCTAVAAGSNVSTCKNQVVGAPTQAIKSVATLEFRNATTRGFAYAVTVSRDVRGNDTGIDLPIWFLASIPSKNTEKRAFSGDPGYGGGVRLGYKTSDGRMTVDVFVGTFKL